MSSTTLQPEGSGSDIFEAIEEILKPTGEGVEGILEYEKAKIIEAVRRAEEIERYMLRVTPDDYIPLGTMYFQVFGQHFDADSDDTQEAFQKLASEVARSHIIYNLARTEKVNPEDTANQDSENPNQKEIRLRPTRLGDFYIGLYSRLGSLWPTREIAQDPDSHEASTQKPKVHNIYSLIANILKATSFTVLNGRDDIQAQIQELKPPDKNPVSLYDLQTKLLQSQLTDDVNQPLKELYELIAEMHRALLLAVPGRYILGLTGRRNVTVTTIFYQEQFRPYDPFSIPDKLLNEVTVALPALCGDI